MSGLEMLHRNSTPSTSIMSVHENDGESSVNSQVSIVMDAFLGCNNLAGVLGV
jgi:hypothetical protein